MSSRISLRAHDITVEGGARVMASESTRQTEVQGLQGVGLAVSPLSTFQQRLVAIEQESIQHTRDEKGNIIKRGLTGAALLDHIVKVLQDEGHGRHNRHDIPGLLDECENILRRRAVQSLE